LTHGTHFLRAAPDGADMEALVAWLRDHDGKARAMGEALFAHYAAFFKREGLVEYTRVLLLQYARAVRIERDEPQRVAAAE
jgi:hypothetical protein